MPLYELVCLKDEDVNVKGLIEITLYKPSLIEKVKIEKSLDINVSDDEIYSLIKNYIYGRECSYAILRSVDKRKESEIGTLIVGKTKPYMLSPIPLRVKEIRIYSKYNPSQAQDSVGESKEGDIEGDESNIILTNELWSLDSVSIDYEAYVYNAKIKVLDNRVTAIRVVTDEMDRIIVIDKEKNTTTKVSTKQRKKKRRKAKAATTTKRRKRKKRRRSKKKR